MSDDDYRKKTTVGPPDDIDHFTYYDVTEGDLDIHNPLSHEGLEQVVDYLAVGDGQRLLDVGCGNGYLLTELARRHDLDATGIDHNPLFIDRARRRSEQVSWILGDARQLEPDAASFDVGICLGATFALDGFDNTAAFFARALRAGGRAAIAEIFTDAAVTPITTAAAREETRTLKALVHSAEEVGLELTGLVEPGLQDWDRYRSGAAQNFRSWAGAHPDDPRLPGLADRVRRDLHRYVEEGRPHYRWAVLVFERADLS